MNRYLRICAALAVVTVASVLAGNAQAALTITDENNASGTLQDWIDLGQTGFQQDDKLWIYNASTILPGTTPITFSTETLGTGTVLHTLAIGEVPYTETGATLEYTITIVGTSNVFTGATLDTTTNGTGTSAVKNFFGPTAIPFLTLTSTNGSADTAILANGLTTLSIQELWTVDPSGKINQTFNTFTEGSNVPEPVSIAVWTLLLGCIGLTVGLRRHR